jgi:hypothetical protein
MPAPRCRPFTVLDAMILVAATAGGLALIRVLEDPHDWWDWRDIFHPGSRSISAIFDSINSALLKIVEPAWMLTLALACLHFRKPWPKPRRLAREPGFVACGAVLIASALRVLGALLGSLELAASQPGARTDVGIFATAWETTAGDTWPWLGLTVASVWGLLVVTQTLRPQRNWIDRAGRILGGYWLAISFANAVVVIHWAGHGAID